MRRGRSVPTPKDQDEGGCAEHHLVDNDGRIPMGTRPSGIRVVVTDAGILIRMGTPEERTAI